MTSEKLRSTTSLFASSRELIEATFDEMQNTEAELPMFTRAAWAEICKIKAALLAEERVPLDALLKMNNPISGAVDDDGVACGVPLSAFIRGLYQVGKAGYDVHLTHDQAYNLMLLAVYIEQVATEMTFTRAFECVCGLPAKRRQPNVP